MSVESSKSTYDRSRSQSSLHFGALMGDAGSADWFAGCFEAEATEPDHDAADWFAGIFDAEPPAADDLNSTSSGMHAVTKTLLTWFKSFSW